MMRSCLLALAVASATCAPCPVVLEFDGFRIDAMFDDADDDAAVSTIVRNVMVKVLANYPEGSGLVFYGGFLGECGEKSRRECFYAALLRQFDERRARCIAFRDESDWPVRCGDALRLGHGMPRHCRVVVTGTGRAGTSFLMRIFTLLGLDTGFDLDAALDPRQALEASITADVRVVKQMWYVLRSGMHEDYVSDELRRSAWESVLARCLSLVVVPLRDLGAVAASRAVQGANPGGLYAEFYAGNFPEMANASRADAVKKQEQIDAGDLAHLSSFLARWEIRAVYLDFDRMTLDPGYAYRALGALLRPFAVDLATFSAAFAAAAAIGRGEAPDDLAFVEARLRELRHVRDRAAALERRFSPSVPPP